ncbi:hypothetical protein LJ655_13770 [Paraburkholderia sp. MMS20-SJTN17]|uniref:OmpA-like domain-containing protein n=1 Tax=Paraburkholderia translucens TaxID=2886945 RepID=A0ABS8KE04_9BURK|nr:hypothetical protein [Paraburkholderia sp. MMS20-SJTN17]MCC8402940.1 hypothetical protein [Paraburkholderia sp. MMS20-SJTN17]
MSYKLLRVMMLCAIGMIGGANACTISEGMENSLPLNSVDIPNSDRLRIADMVMAARQWPDAEIRGIVYAGGYVKEQAPKTIAEARAAALKTYLVQLGVKEGNIWIDTRIIKKPDIGDKGSAALNQISVTLVPICNGGCERLCNDSRVTPTTKAIK